jgi:hypothetical protein
MIDRTETNPTEGFNGNEARILHTSWKNSYWIVILIALSIGIFTVTASVALDWAIHGFFRRIYASDLLDFAAASLLSGIALVRLQRRRRELLVRMQIIEDVNHHVRNALTSITLSASLHQDAALNGLVRDACDRIDWVLNDVLPQTIGAKDAREINSRWHSGRRLIRTSRNRQPE